MATQGELFKANISQVLRTIWLNDSMSRIDLSKNLKMDKSTVTKIVTHLLELGIIHSLEEGDAKPSGGRKPIPLSVNTNFGCILGIEILTDSYVAAVLDLNGKVLHTHKEKISFNDKTLVEVFFIILEDLKPITKKLGLIGVVVGLGGIINSKLGRIIKSNPLNIFSPLDFCEEVKKTLSIPVLIENDANCCCWGELTSLKTDRPENMLFMLGEFREVESKQSFYHGIALGFGVVISGKVYYGSEFSAGEFKSLFSKIPSISQFSLPDETIENIQNKPEELMVLFRELCVNISLLVNFFNISDIVLGGAIEKYSESLELMLNQEIQSNWLYPDQMTFKVRNSHQSNNIVAVGAASMFLERLFGVPQMNTLSEANEVVGVDLLNEILKA